MPTKQVLLGDQILHGQDRAGHWVVEKLTGWYEAPESKGGGEARPLSDGDFEGQVNYGPRMVTVDGILFHRSRGELVSAMERFNSLAKLTSQKLVVTDAGLSRYANVKSLGTSWTAHTLDASRFQVRLKSDDSFKYGESYAPSGAVGSAFDVFHRGTVEAWPVITVSGSLPGGYELTLGGRLVSVTRAVTSGSPHTLDMRTGILRVGGSVVRSGYSYAELFSVKPGLPQSFYSVANTSGSGTATVRYSDTYI
ncbi:hypothetical protein ABZ820_33535 [Streptomyces diacarni]|uniref:hypothetical protein n=1 Tax=Streptomyces diacarni TaxID=2800381 RepID=UPI0033FB76FC